MKLGTILPADGTQVQYADLLTSIRERVVCVMTTGQEWQFTPYKWKEPKELFHHGRIHS
jgi:hypothetical protein